MNMFPPVLFSNLDLHLKAETLKLLINLIHVNVNFSTTNCCQMGRKDKEAVKCVQDDGLNILHAAGEAEDISIKVECKQVSIWVSACGAMRVPVAVSWRPA